MAKSPLAQGRGLKQNTHGTYRHHNSSPLAQGRGLKLIGEDTDVKIK